MARFSLSSNYSFEDLNRVEAKIQSLWDAVHSANPAIPAITVKTNWTVDDFPYIEELDRIKNNIILLTQWYIFPYEFQDLLINQPYFDFKVANKIEIDLEAVERSLNSAELRYCSEGYSGEGVWL